MGGTDGTVLGGKVGRRDGSAEGRGVGVGAGVGATVGTGVGVAAEPRTSTTGGTLSNDSGPVQSSRSWV
jgi:hypothetical protein